MAIEFEAAPGAARGEGASLAAELSAALDWAGDNMALALALSILASLMLVGAFSYASNRRRSAHDFPGDWSDGGDCGGGD